MVLLTPSAKLVKICIDLSDSQCHEDSMNWNITPKSNNKWISDTEKDTSNSLCKEKRQPLVSLISYIRWSHNH